MTCPLITMISSFSSEFEKNIELDMCSVTFRSRFNYRNRLLTNARGVLNVIARISGVILIMVSLGDVRGVRLQSRRTEILSHKVAPEAQILYPDALEISRDVVVEVLKTLTDPTGEF